MSKTSTGAHNITPASRAFMNECFEDDISRPSMPSRPDVSDEKNSIPGSEARSENQTSPIHASSSVIRSLQQGETSNTEPTDEVPNPSGTSVSTSTLDNGPRTTPVGTFARKQVANPTRKSASAGGDLVAPVGAYRVGYSTTVTSNENEDGDNGDRQLVSSETAANVIQRTIEEELNRRIGVPGFLASDGSSQGITTAQLVNGNESATAMTAATSRANDDVVIASPMVDDDDNDNGDVEGQSKRSPTLPSPQDKKKVCGLPRWLIFTIATLGVSGIVGGVVAAVVGRGKEEKKYEDPSSDAGPAPSPTAGELPFADLLEELRPNLFKSTIEAIEDPESPQYKALQWMSATDTPTEDNLIDRFALMVLFFSFDAVGDDELAQPGVSVCDWNRKRGLEDGVIEWGVKCDDDGSVRSFEDSIFRNEAEDPKSGFLPIELALLSHMERFAIKRFEPKGFLPTEIGLMTNLSSFALINSENTGTLPMEYAQLTNLQELIIQLGRVSGKIPSEYGALTKLTHLNLAVNKLTGTVPESLAGLTNLRGFYLTRNDDLSGTIPTFLGDLKKLIDLNWRQNQFHGSLPSELGLLTRLKTISLAENDLSGSVPTFYGRLTRLENFNVRKNDLSGALPSELGLLTKMTAFLSENNLLSGTVPVTYANLTLLHTLYLEKNDLTGDLDPVVCSLKEFGVLTESWADCAAPDRGAPEIKCTCCTNCVKD